MKWTKEQQDAIEIRNKNILVSAAAGSGKTAVLVERIKQLILKDQVLLDRMLIVTFSNAAASEMREKIVDAISLELEEASDNQKKASYLREQLNLIHRANISTFHAFSMEVIRRYFYLIDMEPNFKICDEAQKTILQAEAMEQLFSNLYEAGGSDFIDFLSKYAKTKNDNAVKEMIFEAHNFVQSIPDSFSWLRQQAETLDCTTEDFQNSPAFGEIKEEVIRTLDAAEKSFQRAGELLETQGITSLLPKWKLDMETLETLSAGFETMAFDEFGGLMNAVKFQTFTASKGDKESYEEIKEAVSALRDQGKSQMKKLLTQYFARPLDAYAEDLSRTHRDACFLCSLVEEFDRIYKEKKLDKGLIDFSDIEHYALAVLAHEEAAAEYRDKFEYIFIDEYQDSNIVQETLIGKIKRENNLFMVGDVKQSIYKFRLAEPEIFIRKYEAFKTGSSEHDIKLDLNKNFRSKDTIIHAVNDIFKQIMNKELSGLDYDDAAALYPGRPYEGDLNYPVELQIVDEVSQDDPAIDDEIKELKKAEIEALAAVQIIREAKGSMIFDAKRGENRPLRNRDIVVLLRSAKGYAEIYYEALMKEGIPAFVDANDGYFDTLEIEIFLNLIRLIDNRKQDLPLISVLRSSIFGFAIEDLIKIRIGCKEGAYHQAFAVYAESGGEEALQSKCRDAAAQIAQWKRDSVLMPLEDFLWMLIRETGYYAYIGAIPGGSQRQANLRALVDKAVQFQKSQMKGLFSFINYIEAIKKRNVPTGQVRLIGENDDVVRIMTIHKSKGLEFPLVLVGGLGKRFNRDSDTAQISLHKDVGFGIRYVDQGNSCFRKTILQTVIERKKRRESLAEELRILYVAFTRAMDRLVLLGTVKDAENSRNAWQLKGTDWSSANSFLDFLVPAMEQTEILYRQSNRKDISLRRDDAEQTKDDIRQIILGHSEAMPVNEALSEEIGRRLSYEYGHREALRLKSKFTVSELSRIAKEQHAADEKAEHASGMKTESYLLYKITALESPKFTRDQSKFTAAERGTILHKIMEQVDFRSVLKAEKSGLQDMANAVRLVITDLVNREILSKEEAEEASVEKILGFFRSEVGQRAGRAEHLYKEASFNIMKELSGEKIIIQGTIDCYFEEDGAYVLLDYKSNFIADPESDADLAALTDSYRMQLELYKEALERIRGIRVKEAYLYLFSAGKEIRVL